MLDGNTENLDLKYMNVYIMFNVTDVGKNAWNNLTIVCAKHKSSNLIVYIVGANVELQLFRPHSELLLLPYF